jgi:hypothetical protein
VKILKNYALKMGTAMLLLTSNGNHGKRTMPASSPLRQRMYEALKAIRRGITPDLDTKDCDYLKHIIDLAITKAEGGGQ